VFKILLSEASLIATLSAAISSGVLFLPGATINDLALLLTYVLS